MINEIELCNAEPKENPYKPGTMWIYKEDFKAIYIITNTGYVRLRDGSAYTTENLANVFENYTQVYCVTIKRDRSG